MELDHVLDVCGKHCLSVQLSKSTRKQTRLESSTQVWRTAHNRAANEELPQNSRCPAPNF